VDPSPMEESGSEQPAADEAAAARAKKMAAAKDAAAAACAQMAAAAKGPYGSMHSSVQVVLLTDEEMWDTIAVNWCKPGRESIRGIVDTWEGRDLAACVFRLGLPVLYAKKNYVQHMRRSVVEAALAHAKAHPELFESAGAQSEPESGGEQPSPRASPRAAPPPLPPKAVPAQRAAENAALSLPPPARSAPMRSAAAAAIAALNDFAPQADSDDEAPISTPKGRSPGKRAPPSPARPARRSSVAMSPPPRGQQPLQPSLRSLGGYASPASPQSSGDDSDGSESDWLPSSGVSGRRMRDEVDHQLARAGVQSSFAKGFVANARFAAGGRTMYQLYKEVTSAFSLESAKRECLALSRILDALLRGDTATALEHTCRRLGGVHTAAETGNWAMCERLETEAEQRSFVPDAFMRSALRSVVQMQAVKKSAAEGFAGKGARGKGASASGREERRSSAKPNKKGSKEQRDTPSGAGASHKKKAAGSDS